MYFVTLAGRNYNIAIFPRAGAPGQQSAAFTSRLETCRGPIQEVDCDITIDFDWDAGGAGSGTGQVTIFSGSSSASTIPAPGNPLIYVGITNLTYTCPSYNSVLACPPYSNATTTTTTTTSTTTTTTTTAPISYSDPIIKHDQYSSSYNSGTGIWPNTGSGGSTYDLNKNIFGNINSGGSGTATFLGLTGSLVEELFIETTLYGSFINLYDKSFSYAAVFRVESPSSGYTISSVRASSQANGFGISGGSDIGGPYVKAYLYRPGSDLYGPSIRISTSPKWYLGVLTFDKTAGSSDAAKFYLNTVVNNFTGLNAIPSPSTFFNSDAYSYNVGLTLNPVKVAALAFWQNTVLTQAQVQNLYNEYNSRYTLG